MPERHAFRNLQSRREAKDVAGLLCLTVAPARLDAVHSIIDRTGLAFERVEGV